MKETKRWHKVILSDTSGSNLQVYQPSKFLFDSGLLFEINRTVLHPLGLALAITIDDDSKNMMASILDVQDDPEGWVYEKGTFLHGNKKYEEYMKATGDAIVSTRVKELGFKIQTKDTADVPKKEPKK